MLIGISGFIWKRFQNNTVSRGHNVTDGVLFFFVIFFYFFACCLLFLKDFTSLNIIIIKLLTIRITLHHL